MVLVKNWSLDKWDKYFVQKEKNEKNNAAGLCLV